MDLKNSMRTNKIGKITWYVQSTREVLNNIPGNYLPNSRSVLFLRNKDSWLPKAGSMTASGRRCEWSHFSRCLGCCCPHVHDLGEDRGRRCRWVHESGTSVTPWNMTPSVLTLRILKLQNLGELRAQISKNILFLPRPLCHLVSIHLLLLLTFMSFNQQMRSLSCHSVIKFITYIAGQDEN